MKNYYDILGVSKTATSDEIKKAYRTLAFKYHPDRNPGDAAAEERFKEVNAAYEVLGDEAKRRSYDLTGQTDYSNSYSGARNSNQYYYTYSSPFGEGEETFWDWFNGGQKTQENSRSSYSNNANNYANSDEDNDSTYSSSYNSGYKKTDYDRNYRPRSAISFIFSIVFKILQIFMGFFLLRFYIFLPFLVLGLGAIISGVLGIIRTFRGFIYSRKRE